LAFTGNPTRTGLLQEMRVFAESREVNVPLAVLRTTNVREDFQKAALMVVTAAQKDLDVETANWIVKGLRELPSSDEDSPQREALSAARSHAEDPAAIAALALGLIDCLTRKEWSARAAAFDALDDVLRRRTSNLGTIT
jgi:hypothetical protein